MAGHFGKNNTPPVKLMREVECAKALNRTDGAPEVEPDR